LWIKVVKKKKGAMVDRVEVMNAILEEAKRKTFMLHVCITRWTEKGTGKNQRTRIGALDIPISLAWRG
jgi:hypothetical protein